MTERLLQLAGGADAALLQFINLSLANPLTDTLMPLITRYGWLLFVPFVINAFVRKKSDLLLLFFVLTTALFADFASSVFKELGARPRPCQVLEFVRQLVGCGKSFSMPSNHSSNSFAIAFFLFFADRKSMWPFVIAALIALSRIFIGAHYPGDVAAGALLGAACGFSVFRFYDRLAGLRERKPGFVIMAVVLVVMSVLRLLYIKYAPVDLSGDEAHYWQWSRNLDLSYYSKGPAVAYVIFIGTKLFGHSEMAVRFFAIVFSGLSSLFMYRTAFLLCRNDRVAALSGLLFQAVPLLTGLGVLMTIDSPFILLWTASLYLFVKIHWEAGHDTAGRWTLLGVLIGLGMLAKYTMIFFYASAACFLIASPETRDFWRKKRVYLAVFSGLVTFSPVIIWNYEYGWVTLKHTAYHAEIYSGFKLMTRTFFDFLGSQVLLLSPVLFVLIFYAFKAMGRTRERRLIVSFFAPVFLFFLVKSLQGKVQANWAMAAYPPALIAVAWLAGTGRLRKVFAAGVVLAVLVTVGAHAAPCMKLPVKKNIASRIMGWAEMGEEVSRELDAAEPGTFIFSEDYQLASLLSFYVKGHPFVHCVNFGRRMNQFDIWKKRDKTDMSTFRGKNALYVTDQDNFIFEIILKFGFKSYQKREIIIYNKGSMIRKIYLYNCRDFVGFPEASAWKF